MFVSRAIVGRNVRLHLDPLCKRAGFTRKGNTIYWRVTDNLLQFISLEHPPGQFTVVAAIQPLFVPVESLTIAFGDRLGRFIDGLDHWFPADTEEALITGLQKACREIEDYAFPWFDELTSIEALAYWYRNGGTVGNGKYGTGLFDQFPVWMGYCHAYLGNVATAIELIEANLDKAIRREWPLYQPTRTLLNTLWHDPEQVADLLRTWASETRERLGLSSSTRNGAQSAHA